MTQHFEYHLSTSEGDNQSEGSSAKINMWDHTFTDKRAKPAVQMISYHKSENVWQTNLAEMEFDAQLMVGGLFNVFLTVWIPSPLFIRNTDCDTSIAFGSVVNENKFTSLTWQK